MEILIIVVIVMFAFIANIRIDKLEDNIEDIECRLEIMHAILLDLQPKIDKDLPVRLPEDVLEEMLDNTKQEMFLTQEEKIEFIDNLKSIVKKKNNI